MRVARTLLSVGLLVGVASFGADSASAQSGLLGSGSGEAPPRQDSWDYQESAGRPSPQEMVYEKAQARAVQRMNRMAALEWHGYSIARPRTVATPFTGLYGGQWQANLYGRPDAWHTGNRHTWVVVR